MSKLKKKWEEMSSKKNKQNLTPIMGEMLGRGAGTQPGFARNSDEA